MASFFIVSTASAATILGLVFSKIKSASFSKQLNMHPSLMDCDLHCSQCDVPRRLRVLRVFASPEVFLRVLDTHTGIRKPSVWDVNSSRLSDISTETLGVPIRETPYDNIAPRLSHLLSRVRMFAHGRLIAADIFLTNRIFFAYLVNCLVWSTGVVCVIPASQRTVANERTPKVGLIEIPVGFSVAMSCVMGSRLVLNVRHMKRQMELGISDSGGDVLHIPFYSRQAAVASRVVFANRRSMVDTTTTYEGPFSL